MQYSTLISGLLLLMFTLPGWSGRAVQYQDVQIEIVADDGRVYPLHQFHHSERGVNRAYLEAVYGENYAIRVRNLTGNRIGVVIAVDGRNIVSGQRSYLKHNERMYILAPYEQASYKGWRTSNQKINRFYFTDAGDSYAGAWDDYSAMGVIAAAVFPEQRTDHYLYEKKSRPSEKRNNTLGDMSGKRPGSIHEESGIASEADKQTGTGYGSEQHSYARVVHFDPVSNATSKVFYKYEWRQTLCAKRIISCYREPENRFWSRYNDYSGFAPSPPR